MGRDQFQGGEHPYHYQIYNHPISFLWANSSVRSSPPTLQNETTVARDHLCGLSFLHPGALEVQQMEKTVTNRRVSSFPSPFLNIFTLLAPWYMTWGRTLSIRKEVQAEMFLLWLLILDCSYPPCFKAALASLAVQVFALCLCLCFSQSGGLSRTDLEGMMQKLGLARNLLISEFLILFWRVAVGNGSWHWSCPS